MEDATLCETADAAPASLGAASESGAKIDQSLTCQSSEKRTRDEGAKLAPTFARIKRARTAQSRAGGPGQCRGPAPTPRTGRATALPRPRASASRAPGRLPPGPRAWPRQGAPCVASAAGLGSGPRAARPVRGPAGEADAPSLHRAAPACLVPTPLPRPIAYHTRTPPPSQGRRRPDHRGGRRAALPLQAVGDRCAGARELPPTQRPHDPTRHPRAPPSPHTPQPLHARCML